MIRRAFLSNHVTRHPLQFASARPIQRPTFPRQSRLYARPAHKGPHPLWFATTIVVGFTSFFYLVKSRRGLGIPLYTNSNGIPNGTDPMNQNPSEVVKKLDADGLPVLHKERNPRFSRETVHVIFVLGGPGTGKGTLCSRLVRDWDFVHLSAGDLLRGEQQREGSQYGSLIKKFIQEGEIVPMEITVGLLQNAMQENVRKDRRKFLIDGFPRKMDQALAFEANVCESKIVLYLEGPEEIMVKRLTGRGRSDDNEETIKKRLQVNKRDAEPVVAYFDKAKKLVRINCNDTPDGVYTQTLVQIQAIIEGWER